MIDLVAGPHDVLVHGGEELRGPGAARRPRAVLGVQHARVLPLEAASRRPPRECTARASSSQPRLAREPFQEGEVAP